MNRYYTGLQAGLRMERRAALFLLRLAPARGEKQGGGKAKQRETRITYRMSGSSTGPLAVA